MKPSPDPRTLALKKVGTTTPGLDTKNFLGVRLLQSKIPLLREVTKDPQGSGRRGPEGGREGSVGGSRDDRALLPHPQDPQVSRPSPTDGEGRSGQSRALHRRPLSMTFLPPQPPGAVHHTLLLPMHGPLQVFHPLPDQALILLCSVNSYSILKSLLKNPFLHEAVSGLPSTHVHIDSWGPSS